MTSQEAREELDDLRIKINALNDKKDTIVRAWEGKMIRQNDPLMEKPVDLILLNKMLGALYDQRNFILKQYPEFASEYGGKKKLFLRLLGLYN